MGLQPTEHKTLAPNRYARMEACLHEENSCNPYSGKTSEQTSPHPQLLRTVLHMTGVCVWTGERVDACPLPDAVLAKHSTLLFFEG